MNKTQENNKKIKDTIKLIQDCLALDKIVKLREENFDDDRSTMSEIFPIFSQKFPSLFEKILKQEDISMLNIILDTHEQISHGEMSVEEGEKQIGLGIIDAIQNNT